MKLPATLAALFLAALPLCADKVHLKDGRTFEGKILHQDALEVKIDLGRNGAAVTFPMEQVESIERTAGSPEQLYEGRLLVTDVKNADSLCTLADWCAANKLPARAAQHFLDAVKIDPAHPRARGRLTDLGYKEVDGEWLSREQRELRDNPPVEVVKPEKPQGPTSEDVARDRGKSVVTVWSKHAKDVPGVGVWAHAEGVIWVAGPPAEYTDQLEIDLGDKRLEARLLVRDRTRKIALWKADTALMSAAVPSFAPLPEKEPLVALAPGGIIANVFPRGWQESGPEAWTIRLEGPGGGVAIFNLLGELVAISGDGKSAVGALDLVRLSTQKPPVPEGVQNAGASYWRAADLAEGPALEMLRSGSRLDRFDPGLGLDAMNRSHDFSIDLIRLGSKLGGSVDDHVAGLKVARHCARAGRMPFSFAAAELIHAQCVSIFDTIPKMSNIQLARLRAAIDGLGPDPAGLEAAVTGEVARTEGLILVTHDIRSQNDLAMAVIPLLGPEAPKGAEAVAALLEPLLAAQREFAANARAACSRPDPARREALLSIGAGPAAFRRFPELRALAFRAATSVQAVRIAITLQERRAETGSYPEVLPANLEDPSSGKEFRYERSGTGMRKDDSGVILTAPDGTVYRLRS